MSRAAKLAAVVVLVAAVPGIALAAASTQAHIYRPFDSSGRIKGHVTKTIKGHCWTGSLAVNRQDAWRCMSKNLIYDPCFTSAKVHRVAVCLTHGPWDSAVIKLKLTRKLPERYANKRKPSTHGLPWALVTTKGWKCSLETGATRVVHGKRENYFCTGTKQALYGAPERRSEPWKIYVAGAQASHLSRKAKIRSAWF